MFTNLKRNLYYYFNNNILNILFKPKIKSIDETMDYIINNKSSLARYGDGELALINNLSIGFQDKNIELSTRLKEILKIQSSNILICIPGAINSTDNFTDSAKQCWQEHFKTGRISWLKHINLKFEYGDASMTRLYMDYKDKKNCERYFNKIKRIWDRRNIVIIEGRYTGLGVGNDLFKNALSIRRIVAPNQNAYGKYERIYEEAIKIDKNDLILIALGPTATVLAYDLSKLGYQAIDIGHIDIEYEWFLRGAREKIAIEKKWINEVDTRSSVGIKDDKYLTQIITTIE